MPPRLSRCYARRNGTDATATLVMICPARVIESARHRDPLGMDGNWTMNRLLNLACLLGIITSLQSSVSVLADTSAQNVPMLPAAVDSFGAAEHEGWLYVCGGHQGQPAEQSGKHLSRRFVRCDLDNPSTWEALPLDKPLHSLALVSSGKHLYRIGGQGLADPEKADGPLRSLSDFLRFDPHTNEWTALPSLPSARSSHDAIAADGKIYVVGGWNFNNDKVEDWHDAALVFDTNKGATTQEETAAWESLPIPGFRRRNLAVTTWQNYIWAIGGKDDHDVIHRTVFYYDPHRGYWSEGPELPAKVEGLQGYGVAAWGLESGLYVCGADGVLYRLSSIYGNWEPAAELRVQRYCHRLLPEGRNSLLALAGYSVSFGQTSTVERIKVYSP